MADKKVTQLPASGVLNGDELLMLSKPSTTVTTTTETISADEADQSFNDSDSGFLTAGFAVGDQVKVTGFVGVANNIVSGTVTSVTASKMTLGGADGMAIIDEAEGAEVTISKWESRRATAQDIANLFQEEGEGDGDVVGPASSTSGNLARFTSASGKVVGDAGVAISTDDSLSEDSDAKVPTEKAVKGYVDTALASLGDIGDVDGPGSATDKTLARFSGTTGKDLQGSGIVVDDSDGMSGHRVVLNRQTGTEYTLVPADCGKTVTLANAGAITLTLAADLPEGFHCKIIQRDAGVVTLVADTGATLLSSGSYVNTDGPGAAVYLTVDENTDDLSASWIADGDLTA